MLFTKNIRDKVFKAKLSYCNFSSEASYDDFDRALNGKIDKKLFVIPAEPGSGKSRGIQNYLRRYIDGKLSPADAGIIIVVNRLEEFKSYIAGAGLSEEDYSVICSSDPEKTRKEYGGRIDADDAPILFITSQMLHARSGKLFKDIKEFFYKGRPRALRLWDEDLYIAEAASINVDDLAELKRSLRAKFNSLLVFVSDLEDRMKSFPTGSNIDIPASVSGLASSALLSIKGLSGRQEATLQTLYHLSGRSVRLTVSSWRTPCIVGERSRLPDDLAPVFVFDASARVAATYGIMERSGVAIEFKPHNAVSYRNAKFYHMPWGAGKSTRTGSAKRSVIIAEAVAILNAAPSENWLVLYNRVDGLDLPQEIRDSSTNPSRLEFVYWGNHRARNDLRHITKVMCLGLPRYSQAGYDQNHVKSGGLLVDRDSDIQTLRDTEICSVMLQGISRSNMRNHSFLGCGDCEVYVMDSERALPAFITSTFPDCQVGDWNPISLKLTKLQQQVLGILTSMPAVRLEAGVEKSEIYKTLGINKSNFGKMIKRSDFQLAASREGILINARKFRREP